MILGSKLHHSSKNLPTISNIITRVINLLYSDLASYTNFYYYAKITFFYIYTSRKFPEMYIFISK